MDDIGHAPPLLMKSRSEGMDWDGGDTGHTPPLLKKGSTWVMVKYGVGISHKQISLET